MSDIIKNIMDKNVAAMKAFELSHVAWTWLKQSSIWKHTFIEMKFRFRSNLFCYYSNHHTSDFRQNLALSTMRISRHWSWSLIKIILHIINAWRMSNFKISNDHRTIHFCFTFSHLKTSWKNEFLFELSLLHPKVKSSHHWTISFRMGC